MKDAVLWRLDINAAPSMFALGAPFCKRELTVFTIPPNRMTIRTTWLNTSAICSSCWDNAVRSCGVPRVSMVVSFANSTPS